MVVQRLTDMSHGQSRPCQVPSRGAAIGYIFSEYLLDQSDERMSKGVTAVDRLPEAGGFEIRRGAIAPADRAGLQSPP